MSIIRGGKYVITDYMNHKLTLNVGKTTGKDFLGLPKGSGTITVNGRTLKGTWHVSKLGDEGPYLVFETYGNVRFNCCLPSGPAKMDQVVIAQDGRASYNISELLKTDGEWIKARRVAGSSGKSSGKKSSKKK